VPTVEAYQLPLSAMVVAAPLVMALSACVTMHGATPPPLDGWVSATRIRSLAEKASVLGTVSDAAAAAAVNSVGAWPLVLPADISSSTSDVWPLVLALLSPGLVASGRISAGASSSEVLLTLANGAGSVEDGGRICELSLAA